MKQMRFAAAKALNDTAFDEVKPRLQKELKDRFVLRTTYTEKGFRVQRAKPGRLVAVVGYTRKYMVSQVVGETRKEKGVPTKQLRRTEKTRISRSRWPGKLLDQARFFMTEGKENRLLPGKLKRHAARNERLVFRRPTSKRRRGLRLFWVIPAKQRIKPRWRFRQVAYERFRQAYPQLFQNWLARALSTARG